MKRQIEMEELLVLAQREFIGQLEKSLDLLAAEIEEAGAMVQTCTGEWCRSAESVLDDLAKVVYGLSEPRWLSAADSQKIRQLRQRIHDIYSRYRSLKK